jgi:hypothetical protein
MGLFFLVMGFLSGYIVGRVQMKVLLALLGNIISPQSAKKIAEQVIEEKSITKAGSISALTLILAARSGIKEPGATEDDLDRAISFLDEALGAELPSDLRAGALIHKARAMKRKALLPDKTAEQKHRLLNDALTILEKEVLPLNSQPGPANYNIGCYLAMLGRPFGEVAEYLQKAFAANPRLKEVARTDTDFPPAMRDSAEFQNLVKS